MARHDNSRSSALRLCLLSLSLADLVALARAQRTAGFYSLTGRQVWIKRRGDAGEAERPRDRERLCGEVRGSWMLDCARAHVWACTFGVANGRRREHFRQHHPLHLRIWTCLRVHIQLCQAVHRSRCCSTLPPPPHTHSLNAFRQRSPPRCVAECVHVYVSRCDHLLRLYMFAYLFHVAVAVGSVGPAGREWCVACIALKTPSRCIAKGSPNGFLSSCG